jgi:hypothetical protein
MKDTNSSEEEKGEKERRKGEEKRRGEKERRKREEKKRRREEERRMRVYRNAAKCLQSILIKINNLFIILLYSIFSYLYSYSLISLSICSSRDILLYRNTVRSCLFFIYSFAFSSFFSHPSFGLFSCLFLILLLIFYPLTMVH